MVEKPLGPVLKTASAIPLVVMGVMGILFAGIGICVLVSLWFVPFGQFDAPPLIFRLVGSVIALAFITVGGGTFLGAIAGRKLVGRVAEASARSSPVTARPLPRVVCQQGATCVPAAARRWARMQKSPHSVTRSAPSAISGSTSTAHRHRSLGIVHAASR